MKVYVFGLFCYIGEKIIYFFIMVEKIVYVESLDFVLRRWDCFYTKVFIDLISERKKIDEVYGELEVRRCDNIFESEKENLLRKCS